MLQQHNQHDKGGKQCNNVLLVARKDADTAKARRSHQSHCLIGVGIEFLTYSSAMQIADQ
jgi:hypothetical protein